MSASPTVTADGLARWIRDFATEISANKDHLTELDSAIGDADHGANMDRGLRAAVAVVEAERFPNAAAMLKRIGMTLVSTVGGASGPLYGTFFLRMAGASGDGYSLDPTTFAAAFRAGLGGVVARGRPVAGDKTMYDALAPAADALDATLDSGAGLAKALRAASAAADAGRDATIPMQARKGRASYLGERSIGHQDPGATSMALLISCAARSLVGGAA